MTPDQIRHHATEIILDHTRDVEFLSISEHLEDLGLTEAEHDEACDQIDEAIQEATVTVEWPEDVETAEPIETPEESAAIVHANLRAANSAGLGGAR